MAKEMVMEGGRRWRAFSACRHVPASKVGHRGDAGPLGDDGRRAQLQGGPDRPDDRFAPRLRQVMKRLPMRADQRSEEHTSELQSPCNLVCRLLLEKKKKKACNRKRE